VVVVCLSSIRQENSACASHRSQHRTLKELEQLPGVGPTTAKAIVDFRTKAGRFRRVNDLLVIRGISETKLKKMRPYITIGPPAKNSP